MVVESSKNKSGPFDVSGTSGTFPRDFLLLDEDHLRVIRVRDGAESDLTSGIGHTGIGSANGSVVISSGIADGDQIYLLRAVPTLQRSDYNSQGRVRTAQVETDLDLAVMQIQDISEQQQRAVTIPVSSELTGEEVFQILLDAPEYAVKAEEAAEIAVAASIATVPDTASLKASPVAFPASSKIITRAEGYSYLVVASGAHITTAGGVGLQALPAPDGFVHVRQFGVTYGSRAAAAANGAAINLALGYCWLNNLGLDLGAGVIFNSVPIVQPGRVNVRGAGVNYWQKQYTSDFPAQAKSAIVMTGTGPKNRTLFGVSSCQNWGAKRVNISERANYNDADYRLTSFATSSTAATGRSLRQFSVAWDATGVNCWGSTLTGFRVMPDAGGDDGMLDVRSSDRTITKPLSQGDWDVGLLLNGIREFSAPLLQFVGQWRIAGLLIAPHAKSFAVGAAGYNVFFGECVFSRVLIRSVDVAPVVARTATTVDIPWANDHPFGADGDLRLILTTGGRSGVDHAYTGMTKVTGGPYDILRFTGVTPDPTAASYVNCMPYYRGGGSSHTHFAKCELQGFGHGSLEPSERTSLGGGSPFQNPQAQVEISGNELTEIDFGQSVITGYETVAMHMHDVRNVRLPRFWEMNNGGRLIASPARATNTAAVNGVAATETLDIVFEPEGSTLTDGTLDMRPYITEMDTPALFNAVGDAGLFTPVYLRSQRFGTPHGLDVGAFLAAPKGGRSGIGRYAARPNFFAPTGDEFDAALYYEESTDLVRVRKTIRANTRGQAPLGADNGEFSRVLSNRFGSRNLVIPDDGTATFTPDLPGGWLFLTAFNGDALPLQGHSGVIFFDCGSSLLINKANLGFGGANLDVTTGDLTGTTGTDGNVTVSVRNAGDIEIENRYGGSLTIRIAALC